MPIEASGGRIQGAPITGGAGANDKQSQLVTDLSPSSFSLLSSTRPRLRRRRRRKLAPPGLAVSTEADRWGLGEGKLRLTTCSNKPASTVVGLFNLTTSFKTNKQISGWSQDVDLKRCGKAIVQW